MPPFKRVRQPKITTQALLDFDLGESSSDSDFLPDNDDNCSDGSKDESDGDGDSDSDASSSSDSDTNSNSAGGGDDSEDSTLQLRQLLAENTANQKEIEAASNLGTAPTAAAAAAVVNGFNYEALSVAPPKRMCCVCLGERSDDVNEIVECDACGVSVHEGCYGVSDNVSISSTNSTCSTEPWFCEACRAGVSEPDCELCPNKGGIYKETDVGKWVHLICALYVPGVAFGEVEQLSSVTLFEMQYSKWGAKLCSLCDNALFARSGVCIGCDAGMCKTYFHVTCAQVAGYLIEAHHEDDAADPFYAHCKVHSEKEMLKKRRRNYHTLRLNMLQQAKQRAQLQQQLHDTNPSAAQARIQRKLAKIQQKYAQHKQLKPTPWVPTQKMSRLLTSSASACRRLLDKAEFMAVDVQHLEQREAHIQALQDIRKKWHIAPAFSVEFTAYYMDRIVRMAEFKQQQLQLIQHNGQLSQQQDELRAKYDSALEERKLVKNQRDSLAATLRALHNSLSQLCSTLTLPNVELIAHPPAKLATPPQRPISVPTAAALKMGVGFPLSHLATPGCKLDNTRLLSTQQQPAPAFNCGICKRNNDQHLLVKCDTCNLHYHLGCLNPPLTRPPKKSKQYGWQCSECCDKSDVSDAVTEISPGPRKSRTRFNKDGHLVYVERYSLDELPQPKEQQQQKRLLNKSLPIAVVDITEDLTKSPKRIKMQSPSKLNVVPAAAAAGMNQLAVPTAAATAQLSGCDDSIDDSTGKQSSRKGKRKDKHKNKHNLSSDTEKSFTKEHHKRKRKKRAHNEDATADNSNNLGSTIKIIFKTLRLPGEDAPESRSFYVPANAVRSVDEASRPTSVETVEDVLPPMVEQQAVVVVPPPPPIVVVTPPIVAATPPPKVKETKAAVETVATPSPQRKQSPRKASPRKQRVGRPRVSTPKVSVEITCCVCTQTGKSNQVVTCDECQKHYHFACLDPPLKKSPKIRGYSWHCADCDPTDEEALPKK
ncbi:PHD finger protein 14 isoform X1 [Drosophila sulfurigaster albostrigata]|uniref:PHD finger protein 14 isoform X1 n=1 Tax=Drosophila sulfurigaster albostrigata TaxID=89887 RepID=UPI002D21A2E1|nr:PHD finger protein 14 isoform X1 [Drosophila sulfurigaster albostrigata]